jgi:hypothetical protein
MYAALIFAAHRKNKNTGTGTVYGSSKVPRHQHHNHGSTNKFPIAGKGLLSFEGTNKLKIVERCRSVVSRMINVCKDAVTEMQGYRSTKRGGSGVATVAQSAVYEEVRQLAGPGIGHIFVIEFHSSCIYVWIFCQANLQHGLVLIARLLGQYKPSIVFIDRRLM